MPRKDPHTVEDLGEFELIDRIEACARRAGCVTGDRVVLGIGDDAALLSLSPGFELVVSTDSLVEDVHFRWRDSAGVDIGRKALVTSLSDLAAMGARPIGFTFALHVQPSLPLAHVDDLMLGIAREAAANGAPLVGGNVSRSSATTLVMTVMGEVEAGRALLRSGLAPGDRLFVTGRFGGAALDVALASADPDGAASHRNRPSPRLAAGRALVESGLCAACIDCSDGLAADLTHMLEASGVGADVDASAVPRAPGLEDGAVIPSSRGAGPIDALALCLHGGEDYELIFGLRPVARGLPSTAALSDRLGVMVTEIGVVTERAGLRGWPAGRGHRHF